MALLNTHSTVKKFIKFGFTEDQAESIAEAINEQNKELATKSDIALLKSDLQSIKSELQSEIHLVELRLESKIDVVEHRLGSSIRDLIKDVSWIKTISLANFTVLFGALITLLFKLFG